MPKIVDHDQKKWEIMNEAATLFGQQGYYHTSLADIASQCGLSRTALYQYFQNKDDVFRSVLTHILGTLLAELERIERSSAGSADQLREVFEMLGRRFREEKHLLLVLAEAKPMVRVGHAEVWEEILSFRSRVTALLASILRRGVAGGELQPIDPEGMASTIYLLVESLLVHLSVTENANLADHLSNLDFFLGRLERTDTETKS